VDELRRFLGHIANDPDAALWWLLGYTGMRRGEVVALRWEDIDLRGATLSVERAVSEGDDGVYMKLPKSDAGRRVVELDSATVKVLTMHRRRQAEWQLACGPGWRNAEGRVFTTPDGSPIELDYVSDRWRTLARIHAPAIGVAVIRLHDLRHSHATQLLAAGGRPDVVAKRLGHASVAFTLATYGHVYEGDQRAALDRLLGNL
jgi:integrase